MRGQPLQRRARRLALLALIGALLVVGRAFAATGWSGPVTIDNSQPPTAVSCPSASFCAAVGVGGYAQTFNGASWSPPVDPDPNGNSLVAVSCVSASFCAAVDNAGGAITFNGSTWTGPTRVDTTGNSLSAVSCVSA